MLLFKDEKELNKVFPCEVEEIVLRKEDNNSDSYHYHDFYEITYVCEGNGEYSVNGQNYHMNAKDLIIFNNTEPHGWVVNSDEMKLIVVTFSPELIADPGNVFSGEHLRPFIERGSTFKNRISSEEKMASLISQILQEIKTEYELKDEGYQSIIKADILRILTYLIRHYELREQDPVQRKNLKKLEPVLEYINTHYSENINLEDCAGIVYMSPNYFSSFFKKTTGRTFVEYIIRLRLKYAEEMLVLTDMNIADIALECGFRNLSNFYRLYKKYKGEVPKRKKS